MLWLRVPEKVYIKKGCMPVALRELKEVMGKKKAFIVTDKESYKGGRIAPVEKLLDEMNIQHTAFFDIDKDVSVCDITAGAKAAGLFEPDVIIAVGSGNVMNAAKLIRVLYEVPGADIAELSARFGDIRKREDLFPKTNVKASLVTVPTSSGTGEEVTPYVSVCDGDNKYVVADYEVMPEFVVIDSDYMISQTREEIARSAKTALVHLFSAYSDENATEYTDGFVIKAFENIINYLPDYINNGEDDPAGCEKLAQASAMAGIAYANTGYSADNAVCVSGIAEMIEKSAENECASARFCELANAVGVSGEASGLISKIRELSELCG